MRRVGIALLALALTVGAAPAQARRHGHQHTRGHHHARGGASFSGTCSFDVRVRFEPPLGLTPKQGTDRAEGQGPCSGTFTDDTGRAHELSGAVVRYFAFDSGPSSCEQGAATGGGFLSYRGSRVRFALTEVREGAVAQLHFAGERGGSADGEAHVTPNADPNQVVQSCIDSGLAEAQVAINLATTPTLSG